MEQFETISRNLAIQIFGPTVFLILDDQNQVPGIWQIRQLTTSVGGRILLDRKRKFPRTYLGNSSGKAVIRFSNLRIVIRPNCDSNKMSISLSK